MTDNDLENIYKLNVPESHYAALRAVWDSGYNYALSQSASTADPSNTATAATAIADTPTAGVVVQP